MQKKLIGIFILIIFVLIGLSFVNQKRNETSEASDIKDNSNTTLSVNNGGLNLIKGFDLISDKKFQDQLLKYMQLKKEQNYKEIYKRFLSRNYRSKYYRDVKNADEYEESRGRLELITVEFLEIFDFKILNVEKYQVDILQKDEFEGHESLKKVRCFFLEEEGVWKLDDEELLD